MSRAFRVPLINQVGASVEVRRDVGVVGVRDHRNVFRSGLVDGFEDPVDHGTAADGMEDFGNPRSHARAVAGGEYDRSQGLAQLVPIMPCPFQHLDFCLPILKSGMRLRPILVSAACSAALALALVISEGAMSGAHVPHTAGGGKATVPQSESGNGTFDNGPNPSEAFG